MDIVEFPEQTVVYARHQPEYRPLPAWREPRGATGRVVCCWRLSLRERLKLLVTGLIWHEVLTFNYSLQPQLLGVDKPEMSDLG